MMTIPERVEETLADEANATLYCTVHPTVETTLRCNRCGRPMCIKCAVRTPVGYRCRECVREQQNAFFSAEMLDYLIAVGVSFVISFVAAVLVAEIRFFLVAVLVAPAVGGLIATIIWRLTKKRRGRYTSLAVGVGVVAGGLPFLVMNPISIGLYLFLATSAAVARFRLTV
jgi:hypothetical protein